MPEERGGDPGLLRAGNGSRAIGKRLGVSHELVRLIGKEAVEQNEAN